MNGFYDPIAEAARRYFAIPYLYPIQRFVISNILEGKNQIVVLPTGAGKSLCYQLPARVRPGLTVVVAPLLSLLEDQLKRCREVGLRTDALRDGQSREMRRKLLSQLHSGRLDLLFTTPETLQSIDGKHWFAEWGIDHLVVDEAHCVSEWGESFRPAYLELGAVIRSLEVRHVTAFTATASPRIVERIREVLFAEPGVTILSADADRPNIHYSVLPTLSKTHSLLQLVEHSPRPLLIFSRTRAGAERAARTVRRGFPHLQSYFYHAGLNREERRRIEEWYKPGKDGVLAATAAYGMA